MERCHSVQPETGAACLCNPCAGSSFGRKGMWVLRTVMSVNEHHFYNSQLLRDSRRGSKRNPSQDCSNSGPRGFKGCEYILELCTLHSVYKDWASRLKSYWDLPLVLTILMTIQNSMGPAEPADEAELLGRTRFSWELLCLQAQGLSSSVLRKPQAVRRTLRNAKPTRSEVWKLISRGAMRGASTAVMM